MPDEGPLCVNIKRLIDWRQRHVRFIRDAASYEFAWGTHDCVSFGSASVEAVTGFDFYALWPEEDSYDDLPSAVRALRRHGWATPETILDSLFSSIQPQFAKKGDLVLAKPVDPSEMGWAIGVADYSCYFAVTADGLGRSSLLSCYKAYKVGYV